MKSWTKRNQIINKIKHIDNIIYKLEEMLMERNRNLLTITDTSLVKKTDKTKEFMINWNMEYEADSSYPVYQVRLDMLHYNCENYHIASTVATYEAKHGQGALEELCKTDAEAYNKAMDKLMSNSKNTWLERKKGEYRTPQLFDTKKELQSFMTQGFTAITLSDGTILDGNFRFLKLRQQQENTDEPLYLETVILDKEADSELIEEIKLKIPYQGFNSCACSRCNDTDISSGYWWGECEDCTYYHSYDKVDRAAAEYRAYQKGETIPPCKEYEYDEVSDKRGSDLSLTKRYIDFLEYIGFAGDYEFLKSTGLGYVIADMRYISRDEDADKKIILYNIIMLNAVEDKAKRIDATCSLLNQDICKAYFHKQLDISKELQSRYAKANVKTLEEFKAFAEENSDIREKTIENIEAAHKHYYWTMLKAVSITEGSIDELELSFRAYNCLHRAGIRTVAELMDKDEKSLSKLRNMGAKSLREIMKTIDTLKEINGIS